MTIWDWFTSLGADATDCLVNFHCDFAETSNAGYNLYAALMSGIFRIFEWPLRFLLDIILALGYFWNRLYLLTQYLFSPFIYFFTFLGSTLLHIFSNVQSPVTLDPIFGSVLAMLNLIPYFGLFLAALTAALWIKMFLKQLHTLKH